mgnify:CR=1 FL=1
MNGNSASVKTLESSGATVKIQSGGAQGYVGTENNKHLSIKVNDKSGIKYLEQPKFFKLLTRAPLIMMCFLASRSSSFCSIDIRSWWAMPKEIDLIAKIDIVLDFW